MKKKHPSKGGSYRVEKEGDEPVLVHRTKSIDEAAQEAAASKGSSQKAAAPKDDKNAGSAGKGE